MTTGIFDSVVTFLERILQIVQKYGFARVISTLIMVGVCSYVVINVNRIENLVTNGIKNKQYEIKNEHDKRMMRRQEINTQVNVILNNLLIQSNADRCMILEMHNGTNNIAGLPFVYVDATYSITREGVESVDEDYTNLNMSRFYFFTHIINKEKWGGNVKEVESIDRKYANRLRSNNTEYISVSIIHGNSMPIGFLLVTYTDTKNINYEMLDKSLHKAGQKVSNILNMEYSKEDA